MSNKVRYFYLRDRHDQPIACVAAMYFQKDKRLSYGLSVRNPLDHFNRKVARELAAGRLALYGVPLDLSDEPEVNCHTITRRILKDLLYTNQLSSKSMTQIEKKRRDEITGEITTLEKMISKMERQKRELVVKRNQMQNQLQALQGYDKIPARAQKAAKRWLREDKKITAQVEVAKTAVVVSGAPQKTETVAHYE